MVIFEPTIREFLAKKIHPNSGAKHTKTTFSMEKSEDSPQERQRRLGQWSQHLGGLRVTSASSGRNPAPGVEPC